MAEKEKEKKIPEKRGESHGREPCIFLSIAQRLGRGENPSIFCRIAPLCQEEKREGGETIPKEEGSDLVSFSSHHSGPLTILVKKGRKSEEGGKDTKLSIAFFEEKIKKKRKGKKSDRSSLAGQTHLRRRPSSIAPQMGVLGRDGRGEEEKREKNPATDFLLARCKRTPRNC